MMHDDIRAVLAGQKQGCMLQGNCLELLPAIPDKSIRQILTDPPYFVPPAQYVSGRTHHQRTLSNLSLLEPFYRELFRLLVDKVRDDGSIYMFCDAQSYPLYFCHLYDMVKSIRLLVWDRKSAINGYTWRFRCQHILYAEMHQSPPIKTGDSDLLVYSSVPVADRSHPAEKPSDLLEKMVSKSSDPGDIVLDCFSGSGSVGEACVRLGRRFIGIELNDGHCEAARARLRAAEREQREMLFPAKDAPAAETSLFKEAE